MDGKLPRSLITVILTCLSFASLVSSSANKKTGTCCSDGLGLNYTLPMFMECKKEKHPNGSMVQKIPKLIPYSEKEAAACPRRKNRLGIKPGHRVCRFPDCASNPCVNGWCEETMENYKCHCPAGNKGRRCDKQSSTSATPTTADPEQPSTPQPSCQHPAMSTTSTDSTTMSETMTTSTMGSETTSTAATDPTLSSTMSTDTTDSTTMGETMTTSTMGSETTSTAATDPTLSSTISTDTTGSTATQEASTMGSTKSDTTITSGSTTTQGALKMGSTTSGTTVTSGSTNTQEASTMNSTISDSIITSGSTTTQEASTIGSTTTVTSESSTTREPSTTSSTTSKAATTLASSTDKESTTISSTDSTTSGSTTEWKCTATKCFHVYTVKLTFSEAVAYCDSLSPVTLNETIINGTRNASVLFVGSDAEITEVEDLFDFFSSTRHVWVNCFYEDSDTEFVCTADDEGTLTSIRNWRYDQPNGSGNQACVAVVTYDNKWQDRQCTDGYYTVCQIYRVPVEDIDECATNPCSNGQCVDDVAGFVCTCDSGWVGKLCNYAVEWQCSSTKCYHTSPYRQNFDDALAYCSALSPDPLSASTTNDWSLLFVGSDAEINEVETLMGISSRLYIWVNCNDRKTDGEFECFMDPQTPAATTHWSTGQPNGGTRQNCVAVLTRDDKWHDRECHDLYTTICQIVIS